MFNLFANILNPQAKEQFSQAGQAIKKSVQPMSSFASQTAQANTQKIAPVAQNLATAEKALAQPIQTGIIQPIKKGIERGGKITKVNNFFSEKGLTVEHIRALAEMDGTDPDEAINALRTMGIKVQGMDEMVAQEQETMKMQADEANNLGIMGGIKEGAIGASRLGMYLPEIAGNIGGAIPGAMGELAGYAGEAFGVDRQDNPFYTSLKEGQRATESIGRAVTRAGEGDLTEQQKSARRTGAITALTLPVGGGYVGGAKGVASLAGRSAVVGAGFGATLPTLERGSEATLSDTIRGGITGGAVGGVAGPVIGKVIAPAVGAVASKTGKYGQALVKGGAKGLGKSVARDIQAIKTSGAETITRNIPRAVVRRDLGFTPTERAKIERITGQDEGTYILSKGLAGKGKEELAEIFMKQADDMYNGITKNLAKVDAKVQSPIAKEALMDILEQLESSPKIARAYAKDIEGVKAMLARDEFTLSELNNIRRAYDKVNQGMFTVQGKARSGLENAIDVKVRQDLSSQLQNEAKKYGVDVKAMNNELRAGLEMKDALLRGLSQDEKNNFIGLQDLGVSAILSGGNPVTAIATIGAKKYGEKIAPGLAQKAFNLNKSPNVTRNVSRGNTISTGNKSSRLGLASQSRDNVVSVPVKQVKKPIVKLLPAPSGKPQSAKVVNVKPILGNAPKAKVNSKIVDPRKKALDDYLELKSLEESLKKGDEAMNFQARKDLAIKVNAVRKKMEDAQYARAMSEEMKKMMKDAILDIKASFPDGTVSVFNKLNGILKRSKKGYYNDIEGEMGATGLKREFSDATNAYNEMNGTNYSATQFFEYLQDTLGKTVIVPKGQSPAGPTTINTSGRKIIKKAPESPVALERGYTTSVKKPIVKRSADVESGLIEEAKKYGNFNEFLDYKLSKEKPVIMYRTSKSGKAHSDIKDFTYFSPSKEYIKQYLREGDTIVEYKLKPSEIMQYTKDGMEYQYLKDTRNPKILELKELWKKANGK